MELRYAEPLTDWENEPTVADLKVDYQNSKTAHDNQVAIIDNYMAELRADPIKFKSAVPRSTVRPKLIRKQAEWRYSALSEPFLATQNIFRVDPVTFEDAYSAHQNELVLNHQFNTQINKVKLIDEYVRASVDTGTAILRVGWEEKVDYYDAPKPQYFTVPIEETDTSGLARFERISAMMSDDIKSQTVPPYWKECVERARIESQQRVEQLQQQAHAQVQQQLQMLASQGLPEEQFQEYQNQLLQQAEQQLQQTLQQLPPIAYEPQLQSVQYERIKKVINRPTVNICHYFDVYVDPTCEGDIDRAEFIIYRFDSCKANLLTDPKYTNVDLIPDNPQREFDEHDQYEGDNLQDSARRKLTVYEYWGTWDIHGDGTKVPIVASWVGDVMIRLEENPYPDHKPPFVFVSYLPVARKIYGEPDGALLADNQAIIGAITRGIIDLLGKSANSQTGMAMQFLDPVNKRAFHEGRDYEFNPNMPPQQAIFQHTFPEIPQTVFPFLQSLEYEAEALTGVKGFSQGIDGNALGATATGVRGVLDASTKRETGILRRLAEGLKQVARKIIAMNALWLNETEVLRITNQDFVEIRRDDLAGNFDLTLNISSPEEDNAKSESLAFMLQTIGNNVDHSLTTLVLSEICKLKRMPELAERIRRLPPPQPSPEEQQMQQMQMQHLQMQIQKLQAEIQKLGADAQLSGAKAQSEMVEAQLKPQELMSKMQSDMSKAQYNSALVKKMDLDYLNELDGTNHKRNLEIQAQQARAQADKSTRERYMDLRMMEDKYRYEKELQRVKNEGKSK